MREYLGIDTGGQSNNWIASLKVQDNKVLLLDMPKNASQEEILEKVVEEPICGVAIDGQITWSYEEDSGMRQPDEEIRNYLGDSPQGDINWVQSYNSLLVVPLKSRQIAELVNPYVGILIETHPRVNLFLEFKDKNNNLVDLVKSYKNNDHNGEAKKKIWASWCESFGIEVKCKDENGTINHGQIDALVCATICCLFHTDYERLRKLKNSLNSVRGFGPFYVLSYEQR